MAEIIDITTSFKSETNVEEASSLQELRDVLAILEEAIAENLDSPELFQGTTDFLVVGPQEEEPSTPKEVDNVISVDFVKKHRIDEVMM